MNRSTPLEVLDLLKAELESSIRLEFSNRKLDTPGEAWVIDVWTTDEPANAVHAVVEQFDSITTLAGKTIESPAVDCRSRAEWLYAAILDGLGIEAPPLSELA